MTPRVSRLSPLDAVGIAHRLAKHTYPDGDCWIWGGGLDRHGYGRVKINGRETGTHRAAWLAYRSEIPDELVVDHLCRRRACINPWHMDVVTVMINTRRGVGVGGYRGSHCLQGHAYAEHGVERANSDGYMRQICLICERIRTRRSRAKRHAA